MSYFGHVLKDGNVQNCAPSLRHRTRVLSQVFPLIDNTDVFCVCVLSSGKISNMLWQFWCLCWKSQIKQEDIIQQETQTFPELTGLTLTVSLNVSTNLMLPNNIHRHPLSLLLPLGSLKHLGCVTGIQHKAPLTNTIHQEGAAAVSKWTLFTTMPAPIITEVNVMLAGFSNLKWNSINLVHLWTWHFSFFSCFHHVRSFVLSLSHPHTHTHTLLKDTNTHTISFCVSQSF